MKVIDPRTLLEDSVRKIDCGEEIVKDFKQVEKLILEKNPEYTLLDFFYAGYIISNPNVKRDFKIHREKEIPRDNRISY